MKRNEEIDMSIHHQDDIARAALTRAAEEEWLQRWTTGPSEPEGAHLATGTPAPDLALLDHTGRERRLSEFWSGHPALLMFWRHFGCACGFERAERLRDEIDEYRAAGMEPVIIGQGEPVRAAAYREQHHIDGTILCDPDHDAYRAYGVGHWNVERVIPDAPAQFWDHGKDIGQEFQTERRAQGRPLVDDPWRAVREVVVGANGLVRLSYAYQYCEDYPNPHVLTTAARLS